MLTELLISFGCRVSDGASLQNTGVDPTGPKNEKMRLFNHTDGNRRILYIRKPNNLFHFNFDILYVIN